MDDAELNLRQREGCLDGFGKALQTINADDQNVLHATVLQLSQPEARSTA